ncbi:hypothetical protein JMJ55_23505 [Belnapia sp. T6]|uniref:Uncharacterized protein n=1 Tax=Belnapia mucosa TaxID=2804532 RepID=A0ABS1V9H0_9PROT|nr:hypothetical protein [Belnapia mucosa]MBL6458310.1 hypothetical protein [Belnapia mucosa]
MQRRTILLCSVITLRASQASAQVAISQLEGALTQENFAQFEEFISDNLDKVIGLKLSAAANTGRSGLQVTETNGQVAIYLPHDPKRVGSIEVVANSGYRWEHGGYVFDGFFLVKSGGMHQGIISYGLLPVSEAQVRLTPGLSIAVHHLR